MGETEDKEPNIQEHGQDLRGEDYGGNPDRMYDTHSEEDLGGNHPITNKQNPKRGKDFTSIVLPENITDKERKRELARVLRMHDKINKIQEEQERGENKINKQYSKRKMNNGKHNAKKAVEEMFYL